MNNKFEQVFNASTLVGYIEDIAPENTMGLDLEAYYPVKTIDGLDYSYVRNSKGVVELTTPSAFDAEPITQNRDSFDAMNGQMPLFRKKMVLSEKEKYNLKLYINSGNEEGIKRLLTQIYDDQMTLVEGALMTQEFLRSRALMDGKISIQSKGGAVAIDYKVPAENKKILNGAGTVWSDPSAKIIDNINDWCEAVELKTGVRPVKMIMNRNTFKYLRNNTQLRQNLLPLGVMASASVQQGVVLSDAQIMATLKALTGLTEIHVYNKKVQMDGVVYDLIEDNKIAIFPEGQLGNTLIGTSPAELNIGDANASGAGIVVMGNGLAVNTYTETKSPYTSGTEVEFIGIPSFVASDKVVLATVHS